LQGNCQARYYRPLGLFDDGGMNDGVMQLERQLELGGWRNFAMMVVIYHYYYSSIDFPTSL